MNVKHIELFSALQVILEELLREYRWRGVGGGQRGCAAPPRLRARAARASARGAAGGRHAHRARQQGRLAWRAHIAGDQRGN